MKAFTIAAALDAGAITTSDTFVDDNNLRHRQGEDPERGPLLAPVRPRPDHAGRGAAAVEQRGRRQDRADARARSGLYEALRRFGFGSPTGVDIAGEAPGVVWNPDGPNGSGDLTAAQNAFGQGLSVTAMQLVAGYAAIGNGGELVTPHVLAGWTTPDGTYHPSERPAPERIMREGTANTVLQLLTSAVDDGIAQPASIAGYGVAGKTGTAQIAGPVTKTVRTGTDAHGNPVYEKVTHYEYIDGWIDSSFISLLPASDPQIVTLILIHRPAVWGLYQMAETPADLFRSAGAADPRLPRYPAGSSDAAGGGEMRLLDSAPPSASSRVPPSIRLDDLLAATGGRLLRANYRLLLRGCRRRLARGHPPAAPSWPCAASGWTATPTSVRRWPTGARVILLERPPADLPDRERCRAGTGRGRADRPPGTGRMVALALRRPRGGHHRFDRQDDRQGDDRRRPGTDPGRPPQRGEPELGDRPADDAAPPGAAARGCRAGDEHVHRGRDRPAGGDRATRRSAWCWRCMPRTWSAPAASRRSPGPSPSFPQRFRPTAWPC